MRRNGADLCAEEKACALHAPGGAPGKRVAFGRRRPRARERAPLSASPGSPCLAHSSPRKD
eukprot:5310484-Pyramimonas_sp.AAC.1